MSGNHGKIRAGKVIHPRTRPAAARQAQAKRSSVLMQCLESRRLMSVGTDAAGWTVVEPARDTRVIYVSSSQGNDGNSGTSTAQPVRSLQRAQALVRDGSADWVLLRRGDTFDTFGDWRKSGRSADEPIYIGAYGQGDRPKIHSGTRPGFITYQRGNNTINNVVIASLQFHAHTYNHFNGDGMTAGIRLTSPGSNWLIEDVKITGYKDNVVFDAPSGTLRNVTLRRSVILDAHADERMSNGKAQGLYVGPNSDRILVEENVFDHNGWRRGQQADRIVYNHNIYTKNGARNVVIRGNVISNGSFYGLKFNSGGVASGNLFIRNSEAVYLEEPATIEGNVITESVDMNGMKWGVGINTQKTSQATIRNNLIAHTLSSAGGPAAGIQLFNNGTPFRGLIEGNIVYNWRNGLLVQTRGDGAGSVVIRNNQFQVNADTNAAQHMSSAPTSAFRYENNTYSAGGRSNANKLSGSTLSVEEWSRRTGERGATYETISYPDAGRTVARYAGEVAGAGRSTDAFLTAARAMERGNWPGALTAANVNAWMFRGFGVNVPGGTNNNGGGANSGGGSSNNNGGAGGNGGGGSSNNNGSNNNSGGSNNNNGGNEPAPTPAPAPAPTPTPTPQPPTPVTVVKAWLNVDSMPNSLNITFSDGVGRSIDRDDVTIVDLSTGESMPIRAVQYSAREDTARWFMSALPEGRYLATLSAGAVENGAGGKLAHSRTWEFQVFAGDANRDGKVDIYDFTVVAANFNRSATFTRGDFDYSGKVDADDLRTVLSRYQKTLPQHVAAAARPGTSPSNVATLGSGAPQVNRSGAGSVWAQSLVEGQVRELL